MTKTVNQVFVVQKYFFETPAELVVRYEKIEIAVKENKLQNFVVRES